MNKIYIGIAVLLLILGFIWLVTRMSSKNNTKTNVKSKMDKEGLIMLTNNIMFHIKTIDNIKKKYEYNYKKTPSMDVCKQAKLEVNNAITQFHKDNNWIIDDSDKNNFVDVYLAKLKRLKQELTNYDCSVNISFEYLSDILSDYIQKLKIILTYIMKFNKLN